MSWWMGFILQTQMPLGREVRMEEGNVVFANTCFNAHIAVHRFPSKADRSYWTHKISKNLGVISPHLVGQCRLTRVDKQYILIISMILSVDECNINESKAPYSGHA